MEMILAEKSSVLSYSDALFWSIVYDTWYLKQTFENNDVKYKVLPFFVHNFSLVLLWGWGLIDFSPAAFVLCIQNSDSWSNGSPQK